jgi:ABC-type amino acid transport substrate-binding protein
MAEGPRGGPLVVATRLAPPFALKAPDGEWTGITIELVRQLFREMDQDFDFVDMGLEEMLNAAAAGDVDAAAAAITITAAREEAVDFTHPFYSSGIGVAVPRRSTLSLLSIVDRLTSLAFLEAMLALLAVLTLVGAAVWFVERRRNAEEFPPEPVKGIASGLWWSAVTMTTVGYGDKAPVTVAGRLLGLVWMFASIIIISGFTAAIATSLTVTQLESSINTVDDLHGKRVLTVGASASAVWLDEKLIRYETAADVEEALATLANGDVDVIVYDLPILRYLVRADYETQVRVLPKQFARQDYGIALPPGSALREPLNRAILAITRETAWSRLLERYMGSEGD